MNDKPTGGHSANGSTGIMYWPTRTRRINEALAQLAEKATAEGWHLTPEGSERYDIERDRIMEEHGG